MLPNRWAKRLKTQESVQRLLCRIGFLLFAVLPTVTVMAGWVWSMTPWSRSWTVRAWEHAISVNMGVDVQVQSVENYAPNSYRFLEVRLKHPETGSSVASIPVIDFKRERDSWSLRLQSPVVELSQASNLVHAIHQRYLCQPNLAFPTTTCSMRDLKLTSESNVMEPIYLESRFQCDRNRSSLEACFDFATNLAKKEESESQSARFMAARLHNTVAPCTSWLLETNSLEIPCQVLAAFQSHASKLGPDATFLGKVIWEQVDASSRAELAGVFQKVGMQQGHDSMGVAMPTLGRIQVDFAQVLNGQLLQADGLVTTESGLRGELSPWLSAMWPLPSSSAVQTASHNDPPSKTR